MTSLSQSHHPYIFLSTTKKSVAVIVPPLLLLCFLSLLSSISCFDIQQFRSSRVLLMYEEKSRLGSMPPSCHNKCNRCHPCMPVQVPTLPVHDHRTETVAAHVLDSNYKPLGWKCHCGNHFYNP